MDELLDEIEATLLYPARPELRAAAVADALNARTKTDGIRFRAEPTPDPGCWVLTATGAQIVISVLDEPLGAEAFAGTIESGLGSAARAALTAAIAGHQALTSVSVCLTDAGPGTAGSYQLHRKLQLLAHAACAELARQQPPLALHWGPTNTLHHTGRMDRLMWADRPLELFLRFVPSSADQRRNEALIAEGARPWLGADLVLHRGGMPAADLKAAARAFVRASIARDGPLPGRSFHHGGTQYRITTYGHEGRVDMIPCPGAAAMPSDAGPAPAGETGKAAE